MALSTMPSMHSFASPGVAAVFDAYPTPVREKLLRLRQLVLETAAESDAVGALEETLKWGEPSYVTKTGSTVRMDWKQGAPIQYALYFHCKTRLIDTFRELYGDTLKFEGKRAIVFQRDDEVPHEEVKHCILISLTYHSRKHLPLLGV